MYVHRIGRTGRVGREGFAISFVANKEKPKLDAVERLLKRKIQRWGIDEPVQPLTPEQIAIAEEIEAAEESGEVDVLVVENENSQQGSSEPRAEGDAPKKRRRRGGRGRGKGNGGDGSSSGDAPVAVTAD